MKKWLLVLIVGLAFLWIVGCSKSSKKDEPDFIGLLLAEINSNRPGNELTYDPAVAAVAQQHAGWLSYNDIQAYQSTGEGGSTPATRLTNAGITYTSSGETGAWILGDIQAAYAAMNSSTLTNSTFTHVGIGRVL